MGRDSDGMGFEWKRIQMGRDLVGMGFEWERIRMGWDLNGKGFERVVKGWDLNRASSSRWWPTRHSGRGQGGNQAIS
eukprot:111310-Chlamydomonas_euryale.AAC.2